MGLFSSGKKDKPSNGGFEVTMGDGSTRAIANSIDCMGDSCPRPQLMTKKAVNASASGEVIEVLVDNPTSMEALPPMCPSLEASHLETIPNAKGWKVYIQKD